MNDFNSMVAEMKSKYEGKHFTEIIVDITKMFFPAFIFGIFLSSIVFGLWVLLGYLMLKDIQILYYVLDIPYTFNFWYGLIWCSVVCFISTWITKYFPIVLFVFTIFCLIISL